MLKLWSLVSVLALTSACGDNHHFDRPPEVTTSLNVTVAEDGTVVIDTRAADPEGDALTFIASSPKHGVLQGSGPTYTYVPNAQYVGPDTVVISVSDGAQSVDVTVSITVTGINDAPIADDLDGTTNENQGVGFVLAAIDIDSPTLTYTIVTPPAHGTVTGALPNITYTPDPLYFGADSFTYQASDGELLSNVATVGVMVADVITCGDGVVEGAEQCDDDNSIDTDGCLTNCMLATCGDGAVQTGVEQCDDSNADNTDGCLSTCQVATCGDGFVQAGSAEQCDDGNDNNGDACLDSCVSASCGDGIVRVGVELCDDGNDSNNDSCLNTCTTSSCGDGFVEPGVEQCDDGNASNTDTCLSSCVVATCGDGFVLPGVEQCDDGNASNSDACLATCTPASCGDGFTQAGVEQCDDANSSNADACTNVCQEAVCGDGLVQAGVETCDDGNHSNTDACMNTCAPASCGDGFVQAGVEQCDDANQSNTDACLTSCAAATCGDGFTQAGVEQCDDANQSNTDACLSTCVAATCGDGVTEAGIEACDDGNSVDNDACHNDCTTPVCGDGAVDGGEECDDGNLTDGDDCGHSCLVERCGDGLVLFTAGEQCDDGNLTDGDGCSSTCQADPFATTTPVEVSLAFDCTTGVANAGRKVAVDSSGRIYAVMQCGIDATVVVSADRGLTFSAPINLTSALTAEGAVVAQAAVNAGPSGVAYAAIMMNTGEVQLRTTEDGGATWGAPALVGQATSTSSGLSLQSFNDDVYIGFSGSGGVTVARNRTRGIGAFDLTEVAMSIAYFDLLYDVMLGTLVVAADTPTFHIRASSDAGVTFASEVNPPGQQYYSDWTIGNGNIYVSGINLGGNGGATVLNIIPTSDLTTSTSVSGLPAVTSPQSRSLAADAIGNAFVASQLDGGGIQLDRLAVGTTSFDVPRLLSIAGTSPISAPLPGNQGVVVIYTVGTEVFVTVQSYNAIP